MKIKKIINYIITYGIIKTVKKIYKRFYSYIINSNNKKSYYKYIDDQVLQLLYMKAHLFYLKRRYYKEEYSNFSYNPLVNFIKPVIWICWFQGLEKAPDIVKACFNSVKKHSNGLDIILITEDNIKTYVNFPDHIYDKLNKGIISKTHFSDLLRLNLLINYGGIWLDATVFLSNDIPDFINNSDLFFFKNSNVEASSFLPGSSWFISSKKNNPLLVKTYNILLNYWEKENKLIHYYLFHISLLLVIKYDNEANKLWNKIHYMNNSNPHVLQFTLFEEFNNDLLNHIFNISFAHKLSYYFSNTDNDIELFNKKETFFKYILRINGI